MLMGMPAVQALRGRAVWVLVALVLLLWPVVLLLMAGINVGAAIRVHRALGARR